MLKILIIGTGAMACLLASKFVSAKFQVDIYGSFQPALAAIRENGIVLIEKNSIRKAFSVNKVISDPKKLAEYDLVLFLTKTYQMDAALGKLKDWTGSVLNPSAIVITLQNGIGNREKIQSYFPSQIVLAGAATYAALLGEPGEFQLTGNGRISLPNVKAATQLVDWFTEAGFEVELVDNLDSLLWGKLVINSAINPLTAIHQVCNGELLNDPNLIEQLMSTVRESAWVAGKIGISLPYSDPVAEVVRVCTDTARNQSSMLRDVLRGGLTEIDAINGQIIASASNRMLDTPQNTSLYQKVKSLEQKKRQMNFVCLFPNVGEL